MRRGCFALLLMCAAQSAAAEKRTFEGTWVNRRYGTSGKLKCDAQEVKPGAWKATFTAEFRGTDNVYKVEFKSKKTARGLALTGTAKIMGHSYKWTGSLRDGRLAGNYRSSNNYYGPFVLKEKKGK